MFIRLFDSQEYFYSLVFRICFPRYYSSPAPRLQKNSTNETSSTYSQQNICRPKLIKKLFEDVAKELSETANILESWVPVHDENNESGVEVKKSLKKKMHKTNKRLRKLIQTIPFCSDYQETNLPVSLIRGSPYTWLQSLVKKAQDGKNKNEAEMECLKDFYSQVVQKTAAPSLSSSTSSMAEIVVEPQAS
ncbi:uncharacterized protein LOC128882892 isoform X2 [Hylaeus volcanicus]|uniref:uncharacterized protein LOC128882892 isoform X2 n=1 Tax=Hylaeus volcanicus TaxID=313075 RepID=UPI0023B77342|nr:uncharacterized protein LOC128882892 isoform X2 [Hylaeus volcanicus]